MAAIVSVKKEDMIYVASVIRLHSGKTETITKGFTDWFSARHYAAGVIISGVVCEIKINKGPFPQGKPSHRYWP